MKKRILSLLTALCLMLTLAPAALAAGESRMDDEEQSDIITITITAEDMVKDGSNGTAIANAITRSSISNVSSITKLKVATGENAVLSLVDNQYIKNYFTSLIYLDESDCRCEKRVSRTAGSGYEPRNYAERGGIPNIEYEYFGGLAGFTFLQTLVFPKTAQILASSSDTNGCLGNSGLTSLNLPEGLLIIQNQALYNCDSLTGDLAIPNSVVYLGNNSFGHSGDSVARGTLTLSNSVRFIDANCFGNNVFTGNLVLPDSLKYLGSNVFAEGSFASGTWTINAGLEDIGSGAFNGICSGNSGKLTIPYRLFKSDTHRISSAFAKNTFSEVEFENGITLIEDSIVQNSTAVKSVKIPNTVQKIGSSAFAGCTALDHITIPNSITGIGGSAFENASINGIFLPKTVTTIGKHATFWGWPENSVIYLEDSSMLSLMLGGESASQANYDHNYSTLTTALAVTNGGIFKSDLFTTGVLATPTRTGYTFGGWYNDAACTGDPVNSVTAGQTYYAQWEECVGHRWVDATCTAPKTCALCGTTEGNALGHSFTNYISNGDATYEADGTKTAKCDRCDVTDTITDVGSKLVYTSSSSDSDPTYSVDLPGRVVGGTVKASPRSAEKGDTVTLTLTPDKGYELDELTVTDRKGNELKLTEKSGGKFTFTMPASRVDVEVTFAKVADTQTNPFYDVSADAYYYEAVLWAVKNEITGGTSATTFSPNAPCTRAQIVTFLWRAAGAPRVDGVTPFVDVAPDAYYAQAVVWAVQNGITGGTSATTFDPNATVTRGQTVTFLYRAAGSPATSGATFSDVAADAYYADSVAWAVENAITNGTTATTFAPANPCTRAQIVTFLFRDRA